MTSVKSLISSCEDMENTPPESPDEVPYESFEWSI